MKVRKVLKLKVLILVAIYVVSVTATFLCTYFIMKANQPSLSSYEIAMVDSMTIDNNEIKPLVEITKQSNMVTWNDCGDKVLMLSWHKYPESYSAGSSFLCEYGEIWTFTDKEILSWYNSNGANVTDWELRFEQLIGLPTEKEYTHFTAFWVEPSQMIRPAYQTDVTKQIVQSDLDGSKLGEYEQWFNNNIIYSYFDSAYPWTRLGYTYDWTDDGLDYGLSEFIILENSVVEVEWTVTTNQFVDMLASGSLKVQ